MIVKKIQDIWKEIAAIVWPSRQRVVTDTMIVVGALVFGSVAIAIVDYGLSQLLQYAITRILS